MESLGLDFGGVVVEAADEGPTDSRQDSFRRAEALPRAFDAIRMMNELFDARVWIISKAGSSTETLSRECLREHRFANETGVGLDRVLFVRERSDKLTRCKELGITHFVDDQVKNLKLLEEAVQYLFLFGAQSASPPFIAAPDWKNLESLIKLSLSA